MTEIEKILNELLTIYKEKQQTVSDSPCKWSAYQQCIDEILKRLNT